MLRHFLFQPETDKPLSPLGLEISESSKPFDITCPQTWLHIRIPWKAWKMTDSLDIRARGDLGIRISKGSPFGEPTDPHHITSCSELTSGPGGVLSVQRSPRSLALLFACSECLSLVGGSAVPMWGLAGIHPGGPWVAPETTNSELLSHTQHQGKGCRLLGITAGQRLSARALWQRGKSPHGVFRTFFPLTPPCSILKA